MVVREMEKFLNEIKDKEMEIALVVRDKDKDCIVALTALEYDKKINVIKVVPNDRVSIK